MLGTLMAAAADPPSVQVQVSNYNGFPVSCFGMKDGWINLTVTGGTPPYNYKWSNGAGTANINGLAAGYYKVDVQDQAGQIVTLQATLEQPLPMRLDVDVYEFANGYNISCYDCSNGNASVVVLGGAAPFTINWSDGPSGAVRYNLAARDYGITVADANGCEGAKATILLRGPERSDWSMGGNANTTPGPQYIGTPDNKDVVFKSNGQELLRLKSNRDIRLWGADTTRGILYRDLDGTLKMGGGLPILAPPPVEPCGYYLPMQFWTTHGNWFGNLCPDAQASSYPRMGTLNDLPFLVITNGQERMRFTHNDTRFVGEGGSESMRVTKDGKVGIGTIPPAGPVGDYRLYVENGIACRDVQVKLGSWPDYVFQPNYALMPLDQMRDYLRINKHLPGIPAAAELEAKQGVELGDMQARLLKVVEEQALYILQLQEMQKGLEQRIRALEASER